jgi:DNA-binding YbaB/EbfC family protein
VSDEVGGLDLNALLAQAQQMGEQLAAAQSSASEELIEGSAGGGKVRVTMTAGGDVVSVRIDPSVVDPADVEMLEDLVVAARHDTASRAAEWASENMGGDLLSGLLGGGGLGALFGGVVDASSTESAPELSPGDEA